MCSLCCPKSLRAGSRYSPYAGGGQSTPFVMHSLGSQKSLIVASGRAHCAVLSHSGPKADALAMQEKVTGRRK